MATREFHSISVEQFRQTAQLLEQQLSKVIVGQKALVHDLLVTLLAGGNALLEGVPENTPEPASIVIQSGFVNSSKVKLSPASGSLTSIAAL